MLSVLIALVAFQTPIEYKSTTLDELYMRRFRSACVLNDHVLITYLKGIELKTISVNLINGSVKMIDDSRWITIGLPDAVVLNQKALLISHLQADPTITVLDASLNLGEKINLGEFEGWDTRFKISRVIQANGTKAWCRIEIAELDRVYAGLINFENKTIEKHFSRPLEKDVTTYWVQMGDSLFQITNQTAEVIEVDPRSGKTLRVLKPAEELRERKRKMRRRYVPKFFASTKTGDTYYLRYIFEDPSLPEEERYSHKTVRVREDGIEITDDPRFVLGEHEGNRLVFDFLEQELMLVPSS